MNEGAAVLVKYVPSLTHTHTRTFPYLGAHTNGLAFSFSLSHTFTLGSLPRNPSFSSSHDYLVSVFLL